jgi:hypothetical protein
MAAAPRRQQYFAYNSGAVRHTSMKFETDVPSGSPQYILEEGTNLIYITNAILENCGRYMFFSYNSGTVIDTDMKLDTDVCRSVIFPPLFPPNCTELKFSAVYFKSLCRSLPRWRLLQDVGRTFFAYNSGTV